MPPLIHPREKVYFVVCVVLSVVIDILVIMSLIGIVYGVIGMLLALFIRGLFVGHLRGNGVRASEEQFPEILDIARETAAAMELRTVPDIFVLQAGGALNAFAMRFLKRRFVVLYSDVVELAYSEGRDALAFVVAHELAHIKRRHVANYWVSPAISIPFLGSAYHRACESTCDRMAAFFHPAGARRGLLVLAAGKRLYKHMNPDAFARQVITEGGFWVWFSEVLASHPHLAHRVAAVDKFLAGIKTVQGSMAAK